MIFATLPLDAALGAVVAHSHRLPGGVLKKGAVLDDAAILALRAAGRTEIVAARLEPGDIAENAAAERLAAALEAPHLTSGRAGTGRVNLHAAVAGLLRADAGQIDRINMRHESLTLGTLPDASVVAAGEMVATVKIIPFAVPGAVLQEVERIARAGPALALHPFRRLRAGLVLTELPGLKESVTEATIAATRARIAALTGTMLPPLRCPHAEAPIAGALRRLLADGAELLLIAGASATVDRRDVAPAGVVRAGGQITHFGMPVDPGNLICLGRIGAVPALVLPGCARSARPNGIDLVLRLVFAGLAVGAGDIMRMGVGGLLKDTDARPLPRARAAGPPAQPRRRQVAALVLAAGQSTRMAPHNKLLVADGGGKPMIARVVDNVLASMARPVLVVTGHRGAEIRAALAGREVSFVDAPDHEAGLSASLKAGIAAVPEEAAGVLVCLGDMPLVTGRILDRILAAYDPDEGRAIVLPVHQGRAGNPVLWDRAFFPEFRALAGDAGARSLLRRHEELVTEVETGDDAVLRDFDTVESLATLPAQLGQKEGRASAPDPPGTAKLALRHATVRSRLAMSSSLEPIPYPDAKIRGILQRVRTIAMVGASANWNRPSYFVMKYLREKGYRVIPVNPGLAGKELQGERVYACLRDIPDTVDMVDVFRAADAVPGIVADAIAIGAKVLWMQLGIRDDEAAAQAEAAGIEVIMNRCPKIEFGRLGGELSWSGVNTGLIRNRPPQPPTQPPRRERPAPPRNLAYGFETRAIHAGAAPDPATGARITPIYQTTSYVFEDVDHAASLFNLHAFGHLYSRVSNPTVSVLEERVAALEGGRAAVAAASGHAAQFLTFFTLLEPGDEFLASRNLYGGSLTQFGLSFPRLGWTCHFVDPTDPENFRRALTPRCKAIFVESLANPGGVVVDIEAIAKVAHDAGIPLIVDNTLASPYLCRPIEWGADIVCHSTTKFLGGHGNALGGVVVESGKFDWGNGRFPALASPEPAYHGLNFFENFGDFAFTTKARAVALRDFGPAMAPMNAFLTITGIETLPLRMERHVANAQRVAEFLHVHARVAWVSYAGLPDSRYYKLAQKYLPRGAGSVFTFGVRGGFEAGIRLVETVQLFSHLANVGDTRSLILHPASTTHRQLSDEQRLAAGAGPDVIRLSVGLETAEDLIRDLDMALGTLGD